MCPFMLNKYGIAVKVLGIFLHMATFKIIICLFQQNMNNVAVMVLKTTHYLKSK